MPKRSTPFQVVVRLFRELYADTGATVTESKELYDQSAGVYREVDIVVEGKFDGEPIRIGIEVSERTRPLALPLVESLIQKHEDLPTDKLLIVSKAGFTAPALAKIAKHAPKVRALKPEAIEVDGKPVSTKFYVEAIGYDPTSCTALARRPDGTGICGEAELNVPVFDKDGLAKGPIAFLALELLNHPDVVRHIQTTAHEYPDKEEVTSFTVGVPLAVLGYQLIDEELGEQILLETLIIEGNLRIAQTEVPLVLTKLDGREYGAAEAPIGGRPAVWVGVTDPTEQTTTIKWQATDNKKPKPPAEPRPICFPEVSKLQFLQSLPMPQITVVSPDAS
ncbi:hypothetical protein Acor_74550 [Acrocarpospora corrugata]|uniref:Restriction endonuclease type IV Mrr domain-containing protein n=1 Tax=Acrocarpospora corrugata TaxID=35763 RepID=A0A5M3W8I8_9ACTN|nr:hypothetical protein [Acrocarpospora corrugata]GES05387.1 hypothetical protein Acor_74550 [Acrocarpospora corrugata]